MTAYLDLGAIEGAQNWRRDFAWPVSQQKTIDKCSSVTRHIVEAVRNISDPETARLAQVAAPRVAGIVMPAVHAALVVSAAQRGNAAIRASRPEARFIMGEIPLTDVPAPEENPRISMPPARSLDWFRERLGPRYWTPWTDLPHTLLAPQASAIAHGPQLYDWIFSNKARVNYLDPYAAARRALAALDRYGIAPDCIADQAADSMLASVQFPDEVNDDVRARTSSLIRRNVLAECRRTAILLKGFACMRSLPQHLLNGTGATFVRACLTTEVIRRGGEVVGFDHVTGRGLERNVEFTTLFELPFATSFVLATEQAAKSLRKLGPDRLLHAKDHCKLVGGQGLSNVKAIAYSNGSPRRRGGRPHVVYASPMFRGWRQTLPPTTADPVQLDWELRLTQMLGDLPICLTCRPHPGGHFTGRVHPLEQVAAVSDKIFEDLVPEADVFLFDWVRSSAFWMALCTDRPVVLIDPGYSYLKEFFIDEMRSEIEKRVRFVRGYMDERNRLQVDRDELRDAILSTSDHIDPTVIRSYFINKDVS